MFIELGDDASDDMAHLWQRIAEAATEAPPPPPLPAATSLGGCEDASEQARPLLLLPRGAFNALGRSLPAFVTCQIQPLESADEGG